MLKVGARKLINSFFLILCQKYIGINLDFYFLYSIEKHNILCCIIYPHSCEFITRKFIKQKTTVQSKYIL